MVKSYHEQRVAIEETSSDRAIIDDFYVANLNHDRSQISYMRQSVSDMRDCYAAIYDIVTKNWSVLKQLHTGERLCDN